MLMYIVYSLVLATSITTVKASINIDEVCEVTNPSLRQDLFEMVASELSQKYNVLNGLSAFQACDPTDPNISPDCYNYNNPSLAYGSALVPCLEETCPIETPPKLGKLSTFYQPLQDHALIVFGCLPPETHYFGVRSYLYEKGKSQTSSDVDCTDALYSPTGEEVEVFPPDPTDPQTRVVLDMPWYDSFNHLSMNALPRPGTDNKFGGLFVHITTANKRVAKDIVDAFENAGISTEAINMDSIPATPAFHLEGDSSDRDSFRTIYRIVMPESIVSNSNQRSTATMEEMNEYIDLTNKNILVKYIVPKTPIPKSGFFGIPHKEKTIGTTEAEIVGQRTFKKLQRAVQNHYGRPTYTANPIVIMANITKVFQGCYGFGDNPDTVYINTDKKLSVGRPGDFAVVCGANHVLLEYAAYTSVGIFQTNGLATALATDEIKLNSATCYAPHLENVENFYCIEIRSDCGDDSNSNCVSPIFDDVKRVLVQYRINLNPQTKTGSDPEELIWPVIFGYRNNHIPPPTC